ncbi:Ig-like domain-containing protein [Candidatus Shapirobacteria bacterium]|nr:Ig-like domain-containing protein [Candidatus Shapirobacteria bacterium]
MAEEKKRSLTPILAIAIVLILVGVAMFLSQQNIIFRGQASPSATYSLANSYIFGSPLSAAANGNEKIKVSVFLLNQQGLGVEKKQIILKTEPKEGLNIEANQPITDKAGQAIFYLSSSTPGSFKISAQVEGQEFPQKIAVHFR